MDDPFVDLSDEEFIKRMARRGQWKAEVEQAYERARDTKQVWDVIRRIYAARTPEILEAAKLGGRVSPYFVDWEFTPIERLAWMDIRGNGMPFYPQYPALGYFIDFADPYLKIGVELDGKAYHDEKRDRARDENLWADGWRIFRIPGRKARPAERPAFDADWEYRFDNDRDDFLAHLSGWARDWSEGIFWAIDHFYYKKPERRAREFDSAAYHALDANRLADFPIDPRDAE